MFSSLLYSLTISWYFSWQMDNNSRNQVKNTMHRMEGRVNPLAICEINMPDNYANHLTREQFQLRVLVLLLLLLPELEARNKNPLQRIPLIDSFSTG